MYELKSLPFRPLLVALTCFALSACGGGGSDKPSDDPDIIEDPDAIEDAHASDITEDSDTGQEDATQENGPLDPTPAQPGVDPAGHARVDEDLASGEVRAGRISGADTGFRGVWSQCREGDFKLYNSVIHVCIQDESTNLFEVYSGGMIVDARRADEDREDVIGMVMPLAGLGTTLVEKVEVVRDGSDGELAVVRVTATDTGIAHIYGLLGAQLNPALDIEIVTEFRLHPDSDAVEIVSWYRNPTNGARSFEIGDWFGYGDRTEPFFPGNKPTTSVKKYHWMAALADGQSYGWVPDSSEEVREMGLSALDIPWAGSYERRLKLEAGAESALRRWFVVGDGTLANIKERQAELRDLELEGTRRTITVLTEDGEPLVGHRVGVWDGEIEVDLGYTDDAGALTVRLEDGDYHLNIEGFAAGAAIEREVSVTEADTQVTVETPGILKLIITDEGDGNALTSRVIISGGKGWSGVALHGARALHMPPGTYTVAAMHGPKYDAISQEVTIEAGTETELSLAVPPAFTTDGWLAGDFHQHMEPSIDSGVSVDDRLLENVSVGVDLVVPTDHEVITDLRPSIEKFGLDNVITTFPGAEVSPIETHIGIYPMEQDKTQRGNGSIQLAVRDEDGERKRLIPEVVQIARQLPNDPVLQLNHARNSSSGMFTQVDFDPEIGPDAVEDDRFTIDFDAMEIINRYNDTCKLLADWSGLLNAGIRLTGLGNSDTHTLSGETGLPRNYLRVDKSVTELGPDDIRQAIRSGRVTVGSHAFIDFSDGKLPGDLIEVSPGDTTQFGVRVQTPKWSRVDKLVAVVNGEVVQEIDRPADATDYLDFDLPVSITVEHDSWVVFVAYGDRPDSIIGSNKRIIAFTNPIYIDTDGDTDGDGDLFEAPGIKPLSLDALETLCH